MPEKDSLVPPVPAQEAPRDECRDASHWKAGINDDGLAFCQECDKLLPAEPQAGAQPDEFGLFECPKCFRKFRTKEELEHSHVLLPSNEFVPYLVSQASAQVPSQGVDAELLANDIMKIVTRGWEPQGKIPVANYNRIFAEVYTLLLRVTHTPSQDEIGSILVAAIDRHITDESLRDLAVIAANGIYWRNQRIGELETHLNSIKSYAVEAAKTPITREDMHDHLKAQTFFDEAKGFERLVLSEIGGWK